MHPLVSNFLHYDAVVYPLYISNFVPLICDFDRKTLGLFKSEYVFELVGITGVRWMSVQQFVGPPRHNSYWNERLVQYNNSCLGTPLCFPHVYSISMEKCQNIFFETYLKDQISTKTEFQLNDCHPGGNTCSKRHWGRTVVIVTRRCPTNIMIR